MPIRATDVAAILPGGCFPMRHLVDGKEFSTLQELQAFVKSTNGHISLSAGKSFMVYLENSFVPNHQMFGGSSQRVTGFNKNSPFSSSPVKNKKAPVRMPGSWLKITANKAAKSGAHDRLNLSQHVIGMCVPSTDKTLSTMTVTVL